ncbi:MAG: protein-glutamate O-methyltransferase [Thermodesulfobacteriota bacterium]
MFDQLALTLTDEDFYALSRLVHQKAGINLHEGKKELVRARLAKRIREGGFGDFGRYYRYVVEDESGDELVHLLDAISTNLTSFFREPKHFAFMVEKFLPELEKAKSPRNDRRLRIWSAGCSTGEEAYSIAMTVLDHSPYFNHGDFKVLGTDLSTRALARALRGVYRFDRVKDIPPDLLRRHFQKGRGDWTGWYRVKPELGHACVFRHLNFVESFPFRRPFDLIFCRNVMIYFDKPTQHDLVRRLHQALAEGGYLFIGHSESLTGPGNPFKYVQPTIYRK